MPFAELPEIKLYYEVSGDGPPVVLLHGLGSIAGDWFPQIPALEPRNKVYRTDARGHGQSDKPEGPYTIKQMAGDIAAFIDEEIDEPVHLIGYSMGGFMAFQLVVDRPELVRSMVIINAIPEVVTRTFRDKLNLNLRFFILRLFGLRTLGKLLAKLLFSGPDQKELRRELAERIAGNDKKAYIAATRAVVNWTVADRVSEIQAPVLMISGDRDYTPVEEKQRFVDIIPNARLEVIANSNHATPLDQPEALNKLLVAFLAEQNQTD